MSETTKDCPLCHGTFEVATAIGYVGCPAHFVEFLTKRAALLPRERQPL
jgi:protein-arginine kinase activator protein McsA